MRHAVPLFLSTAAVGLLAGCPDREVSEVTPQQGKVEYKDIPVTVNRDVDLLFVIDNSGSMKEEQDSLKANFPKFIDLLSTIQGGLPNVHIAVITSDMGSLGGPAIGDVGRGRCANNGDDGVMRELTAGSNVRYISDLKDDLTQVRTRNYMGDLSTVFSGIATVGSGGCGFESHLGAMRRALDPTQLANAGFLRDTAYLGVIIIADEDDCSLKPTAGQGFFSQPDLPSLQSYKCFTSSTVCDGNLGDAVGGRTNCRPNDASQFHEKISEFVSFLKNKKSDPGLVIVAGIIGNSTPVGVTRVTRAGNPNPVPDVAPSCTYQAQGSQVVQKAYPAVRTEVFLKSFPNTTTTTICKGDISDGLLQVATLLKTVIGSPCIDSTLAKPYQCSVLDVANLGKTNETRAVIAQCDASHSVKPCWSLEVDAAKCAATTTKLALLVDRGGVTPPKDTHVIANCVTE